MRVRINGESTGRFIIYFHPLLSPLISLKYILVGLHSWLSSIARLLLWIIGEGVVVVPKVEHYWISIIISASRAVSLQSKVNAHHTHTNMSTTTPTPGKQLHIAIARNDWPTAKSIIEQHKSIAGSAKNSSGSTPLMMAANGKCGKNNKLLLELLLIDGNGGKESAAERNKRVSTTCIRRYNVYIDTIL